MKVCCISSIEEAHLAVRLGADALGLVSEMPSGPGVIEEAEIARIAAAVPPPVATFLLTCLRDGDALVAQARRCGANTLQLCDRVPAEVYPRLRSALPGVRLVQVVHVTGPESVEEAVSAAAHADALLLDSGRPDLPVRELGGTGRVHDWSVSARIREAVQVPIFLAGGLTPENVVQAVRKVGPFGLDLCSGVRRDGRLDEGTLAAFFAALRSGGSLRSL